MSPDEKAKPADVLATQMQTDQQTMFGVTGIDVGAEAAPIQHPTHPPITLVPDGSDLEQFTAAAPNLPFDLPFDLGKLFHLPGAQQKDPGDKK